MIVADEGLNANIIKELESEGYSVEWIRDVQIGMDDYDILLRAKEQKHILITEDKDFGEWVFAHHVGGLTVIFLRYDKTSYPTILAYLKTVLKELTESEENQFITINRNKVRRRKI